jgi:cysteine desulfurase
MGNRPIYLDNNSTTRVDPVVVEQMLPFLLDEYGNASSVTHEFGRVASQAVSTAREQVASLLSCEPKSIVFTSGATEANNLAILGIMRASAKGKHLIVNSAEHKSVLEPAFRLKREGFELTVLPVGRDGSVSVEEVKHAIRKDTVLVSVMHANNEVGTVNPIESIAKECRQAGVLFHTDATQTVGKIAVNLSKIDVDLLSLTAHKIYGPKGIGALYVRSGSPKIRLEPLVEGGGHERRMRSGTLPVHQIIGLGAACAICRMHMRAESTQIAAMRDRLKQGLASLISDIQFNGNASKRIPGNLHVSIPGVNSDALIMNVREKLAISSGSACTALSPEPSHVLLAMGIEASMISSSVRFGIGRFNCTDEIEAVIELIGNTAKNLRKLRVS